MQRSIGSQHQNKSTKHRMHVHMNTTASENNRQVRMNTLNRSHVTNTNTTTEALVSKKIHQKQKQKQKKNTTQMIAERMGSVAVPHKVNAQKLCVAYVNDMIRYMRWAICKRKIWRPTIVNCISERVRFRSVS